MVLSALVEICARGCRGRVRNYANQRGFGAKVGGREMVHFKRKDFFLARLVVSHLGWGDKDIHTSYKIPKERYLPSSGGKGGTK